MRTHDYLLGLSLLALVACNQENMPERPTPTPGAEVKFGVSLNKTDVTRTIYGDENNNAFPIYWVDGDKVLVTSPQCLNGRNTAQYEVSVKTATQNYATSLNKTGAVGVQWGQDDTADFYSVYPADKASVIGTIFSLTMPNVQRDQVQLDNKKAYADMNACFMGAVSKEVPNGDEVNLTYTPLSTAIRFTLRGPSAGVGQTNSEVTISKVVLKADKPIAGDFTVDMSTPEPTVKLGSNTYNEITLYAYYASTGGYLTLKVGEQVELNAFVIPYEGLAVNDNWKLEVTTAEGAVYTTSLNGTGDGKLMPGKIHRFLGQLPSLPAPTNEWDPSNWMVNIPRNVYLSEISIPGSWNSLNMDFQYAADGSSTLGFSEAEQIAAIKAQYMAGARAFHIDTRWKAQSKKGPVTGLSVANGGDGRTYDMSDGKVMKDDNVTFETVLNSITSHVQLKEYMIVFCTFAQDSHEETKNGWLKAISDVCASNSKVVDGRTISANSVVGDVLGKVIVIVNCQDDPNNIENLPQNSKCLFTYTPITLDKTRYKDLPYATGKIKNCGVPALTMYSSQAQTMAKLTKDGNNGYESYNRGYCPTLLERQTKSENILNYSLQNYGKTDYEHAHWMYHGLGGYSLYKYWGNDKSADNQKEVAKKLNPWIDGKIKNMSANPSQGQTRYYPVGLVLMNYVTDKDYGKPVMLDILSLNNKFRKAYDPNKDPLDPSNNGASSDVNSAAPGYNSGMKDNGTDAIGWTRSH
ncbi:MAG: fimbrillin family protein [Bacteroidaceae bacterium]|nr:fimbrillin family protein [Bacteroidaceae bacterium]